jgi:triacylglycerol esterase/lipase EstA (alpha/beta hydrolase family)
MIRCRYAVFGGNVVRRALVVIAAIAVSVGLVAPAASAGQAPKRPLPVGNLGDALVAELLTPGAMPPGANDWSCKPSRRHPYPVVLVHGTLANAAFSWQAISPMLVNAGYCVYAFNYGATANTNLRFFGLDHIAVSAQQLATFTDQVLAATGARKVDMIGHSQGGMMPRYYLRFLGGAAKVHTLIGLAPSNRGSDFYGLVNLANLLVAFGAPPVDIPECGACGDQMAGSAFLAQLNAGHDTEPGVNYVVIETTHDEIVTPYQSTFLVGSNVQNILLQNACSDDPVGHAGLIYDSVVLSYIVNALGRDVPGFKPACTGYGIPF